MEKILSPCGPALALAGNGPKDARMTDAGGEVLLRSCGLSAEASVKEGAAQDWAGG
jgi:hypothetical protein